MFFSRSVFIFVMVLLVFLFFFFFFQAEDGIRDADVTGVQTCALPISYVRRDGEEARLVPGMATDLLADVPDGVERAFAASRNPNAGEVIVSAAPGYEFADLAGRHHVGGGSHGSLFAGDSEVPMLTIGLNAVPRSIVDVAPTLIEHFCVQPTAYQLHALSRAV